MSLAKLSDDKNRDHNFSFKELEDPYTGKQPVAYSGSTNLQPFLSNPSSDNLPKLVKTQLLVTTKKLFADAVHNQFLKEAWEHIECLSAEEKLCQILTEAWEQIEHLHWEQMCRKTSEYLLVSAAFHCPDHVPIFSLPAASIANQSMPRLLAIIHCQQINQRDRDRLPLEETTWEKLANFWSTYQMDKKESSIHESRVASSRINSKVQWS